MTIEDIKKHSFYVALSPQQRIYVVARCLGADKLDAGKEAWNCLKDESAMASANRAERNGNVRWLIKEFQGGNLPTREDVAKQAWDIARNANETKDKINALKLVASILGFETTPADPTAPPPTADDGDQEFDER